MLKFFFLLFLKTCYSQYYINYEHINYEHQDYCKYLYNDKIWLEKQIYYHNNFYNNHYYKYEYNKNYDILTNELAQYRKEASQMFNQLCIKYEY
jgi:hypothetical protein